MLDIWVYDYEYVARGVIDTYSSLVWNEKFTDCGEFELQVQASDRIWKLLQGQKFLALPGSSSTLMVPTTFTLKTLDDGDELIVKGQSAEWLLTHRNSWTNSVVDMSSSIKMFNSLFSNSFIRNQYKTDSISGRPRYNTNGLDGPPDYTLADLWFESLYTIVHDTCKLHNVGIEFRYDGYEPSPMYPFFYSGHDKSKTVIFSEAFDMLGDTSHVYTTMDSFTDALIHGSEITTKYYRPEGARYKFVTEFGDGSYRWYPYSRLGSSPKQTGLNLKETVIDASQSVHWDTIEYDSYPSGANANTRKKIDKANLNKEIKAFTAYERSLYRYGKLEWIYRSEKNEFTTTVPESSTYRPNRDYKLGDLVGVDNGYGYQTSLRVAELTIYSDAEKYLIVPTLKQNYEDSE